MCLNLKAVESIFLKSLFAVTKRMVRICIAVTNKSHNLICKIKTSLNNMFVESTTYSEAGTVLHMENRNDQFHTVQ